MVIVRDFNTPLSTKKDQCGDTELKLHFVENGPNKYTQNTLLNSNIIDTFLSYIQKVLKNKPYVRS